MDSTYNNQLTWWKAFKDVFTNFRSSSEVPPAWSHTNQCQNHAIHYLQVFSGFSLILLKSPILAVSSPPMSSRDCHRYCYNSCTDHLPIRSGRCTLYFVPIVGNPLHDLTTQLRCCAPYDRTTCYISWLTCCITDKTLDPSIATSRRT
jgi:hypothetical protein